MSERYQIFDQDSPVDSQQLAAFLAKDGQLLLPMVELVEQAQCAVDEVIDVMGRATIEVILQMSAEQLAGLKQQGKVSDREVVYHGQRTGRVSLKERQLRVQKPRLRKRKTVPGESAEVEVPAYQAMQKEGRLADRMLEIMMAGVSTRRYEEVLPEMAEQVGISKSQVSRKFIEAGQRMLQSLAEKELLELDILVVYIDGIQFGKYHVICAMGVDSSGHKHVLGLREGRAHRKRRSGHCFTGRPCRTRPGYLRSTAVRDRWSIGLIDNGHSAVRQRMQRVKNWQNGTMALRWTAAAFEASSKGYRRIMGYEQLWILKAALEEPIKDEQLVQQTTAG